MANRRRKSNGWIIQVPGVFEYLDLGDGTYATRAELSAMKQYIPDFAGRVVKKRSE